RLFRHRDRRGARARLRPDGEFPQALFGTVGTRVLEPALAHLADGLVPRLPLHTPRRQPCVAAPAPPECVGGVLGQRPMARRKLDLRGVGWIERIVSDHPCRAWRRARAAGAAAPPAGMAHGGGERATDL